MKFRELKEKIASMEEWQLDQPVVVFDGDDEQGHEIDFMDFAEEDIYWMDGECYGMINEVKKYIADEKDDDLSIDNFIKVPKGQPTLHITDSL